MWKTAAKSWVWDKSCWITIFNMTKKRMLWKCAQSTWMEEQGTPLWLILRFAEIYGFKLWHILETCQRRLAKRTWWERWTISARNRTRKTKTERLKRRRKIFWAHCLFLKSFRVNQILNSRSSRSTFLTDSKSKIALSEKTTPKSVKTWKRSNLSDKKFKT